MSVCVGDDHPHGPGDRVQAEQLSGSFSRPRGLIVRQFDLLPNGHVYWPDCNDFGMALEARRGEAVLSSLSCLLSVYPLSTEN